MMIQASLSAEERTVGGRFATIIQFELYLRKLYANGEG